MHFMSESAPNLRERRRVTVERDLVDRARRATAGHGLSGYTIEELCDDAGISRRTFFNYFASKEDAVLGISLHRDDTEADEQFLSGRAGAEGEISATLLEDLVRLVVARWETMNVSPDTVTALRAAVDREPRLLARALEHAFASEASMRALVEQREGWPAGDLRAAAAVQVLDALARAATTEFLGPDSHEPFPRILARRVHAARALFATQRLGDTP